MINTTVKLNVTHSRRAMTALELRFDLTQTIATVKASLERRFGTSADYMTLKLKDESGAFKVDMLNNDAQLGFYSPRDFYTIHIVDTDPNAVNVDDLSAVEKYVMSEEKYSDRDESFRRFKTTLPAQQVVTTQEIDPEFQAELAQEIELGSRCRVNPGDKRGVVKYVGKVPEAAPGWFIGIQLDEPLGKNDGIVKGTRYFQTPPNHGLFVRPDLVEVGDFRPFDEDEI
mmetsp:Transcript_16589/g.29862  ORF Transcript_16589/g.29862 Transcript_16589/m.29862 type:complete len:228 (+) Transcript_16589:71-754(+)